MSDRTLVVDGMLSGTGVRDGDRGGYLDPEELRLSSDLATKIADWLAQYENEHFYSFENVGKNEQLDRDGVAIANRLARELPNAEVKYFSAARMEYIPLSSA